MQQKTLQHDVTIEGIGLHSGLPSKVVIKPAPANHGIVFEINGAKIPALYTKVTDTKNCTSLGQVSTIEHFMSVFYIVGLDNALVKVDNPELPIMDGSAGEIYHALKKVPMVEQSAQRVYLRVKKEVNFADDKGNSIVLAPYDNGLKIDFEIEFPSKVVGHQVFEGEINEDIFASAIANSRTFCEKYQVDYLKSVGLIKGGSLENALVLDGEKVLNEGGMRHKKECVNHKVLDAIGDLYTSGYRIIGELTASKTGHFHNNEILKMLFSDKSNYELV